MSSQKNGLKYEKDVAAAVENNTRDNTRVVFGGGTSGNVRIPQPDLHITSGDIGTVKVDNVEIKRSTQDRFYIEAEDFEQLLETGNSYTNTFVMMKFTRREPLVFFILPHEEAADVVSRIPECFDPHVTKSGSLRLSKPSTENWPSATAGRVDWKALLDGCDIDYT